MHRLGAILMMLGANIAVGSVAAAFWRASFACALKGPGGTCTEGVVALFLDLMTSSNGVVYWGVIIVGLLVFWRGKRMRAD